MFLPISGCQTYMVFRRLRSMISRLMLSLFKYWYPSFGWNLGPYRCKRRYPAAPSISEKCTGSAKSIPA